MRAYSRHMAPGGFFGQALVVDVGGDARRRARRSRSTTRSCAPTSAASGWVPGCMHRLAPPRVDPLAPEAPLAFVFSSLVGTPLTTSAKFAVVAKSPLTGLLTDALASSQFAIAGKLTGHDAIVDPRARRRAVRAADRRGRRAARTRARTRRAVRRRRGDRGAGAVRARLAHRGDRARRGAGRAVRDDQPRRPARRPRRSRRGARREEHQGRAGEGGHQGRRRRPGRRCSPPPRTCASRSFGPATAKYRELGTLANLLAFNAVSTLPTRNFTAATFDEAPRSSRPRSCTSCAASPATAARPARSAASTSTPARAAAASAWSTRTCSRSARCAGCPTRTTCSPPAPAATSSASTRSPPAARSRGRWSASSAG